MCVCALVHFMLYHVERICPFSEANDYEENKFVDPYLKLLKLAGNTFRVRLVHVFSSFFSFFIKAKPKKMAETMLSVEELLQVIHVKRDQLWNYFTFTRLTGS
ncbi:Hypothetical predicted protein [Octopus vulgaris]|uniref:Uncharacterized protein n=1 Tax=Octopus vulgaris TaxID=6645 RepID=A0AA36AJX0_OCTVU|nr:Hypothetical predicted protein [Octopus vulgaris]